MVPSVEGRDDRFLYERYKQLGDALHAAGVTQARDELLRVDPTRAAELDADVDAAEERLNHEWKGCRTSDGTIEPALAAMDNWFKAHMAFVDFG